LFPGLLQWLKEQQFLLNFVRRWPHSGQPEQLALLAPLLGGALGGEYNHPVKFALFNISRLSYKNFFSFFFKLRIFGSNSDNNIEAAAGHPPQEENNRQQQLVNRRHRRQRQAVVAAAAAGPVNRGHNNVALALHPRNNQQEPQQAPERQQRRRWMANGQHSTWFQGQLSANKSGAILFPFAGFCLKLKRHLSLYYSLSCFSLLFHVPCRLDVISQVFTPWATR
jgi:hypothetical protein